MNPLLRGGYPPIKKIKNIMSPYENMRYVQENPCKKGLKYVRKWVLSNCAFKKYRLCVKMNYLCIKIIHNYYIIGVYTNNIHNFKYVFVS